MVIDYTISVGNIIEIGSILGGGFAVFITLKNNVASMKDDVVSMQSEIKKLGEVLIDIARFDERLSNLDKRVTAQGRQIDELRRGEGFIRSHRPTVDGEYP
jgi:hypothetical protein